MRYPMLSLLLLALLLPSGVAAQDEPTRVCTQITVAQGGLLEGYPGLRGEPPEGECDVIVYLPILLGDSSMLGSLAEQVADEAEAWRQEAEAGRHEPDAREAIMRGEGVCADRRKPSSGRGAAARAGGDAAPDRHGRAGRPSTPR